MLRNYNYFLNCCHTWTFYVCILKQCIVRSRISFWEYLSILLFLKFKHRPKLVDASYLCMKVNTRISYDSLTCVLLCTARWWGSLWTCYILEGLAWLSFVLLLCHLDQITDFRMKCHRCHLFSKYNFIF